MCSLVLFMALSASVSDPTSVAAVLSSPPCSGPVACDEKGSLFIKGTFQRDLASLSIKCSKPRGAPREGHGEVLSKMECQVNRAVQGIKHAVMN